jgi:hypothetical protein
MLHRSSLAPGASRRALAFIMAGVAGSVALCAGAPQAHACGGCFHSPPPSQSVDAVITDHRMVLSISTTQTVLWDQIRYSGTAGAFAWVLPVKPGARIELSQDAWMASLDAATQTVIQGPSAFCGGPAQEQSTGGGGCGSADDSNAAGGFAAGPSADDDAGAGLVQVVSQQVVGPYDAVTVRSSQGEALGDWLRANGYEIPQSIQPTIDAFTSEGFDFIALKLAPGEGVQAMQPVRVITPGANLSLPLRMVAAGVGANVGIELFVLSEGVYQTQNFPQASIDFSKLAWDPNADVSNYTSLESAALAANGGRSWLTEMAGPVQLGFSSNGVNPPLDTTYQATCIPQTLAPACDAGAATLDSGSALTDAGGAADAGGLPSEACQPTVVGCDDLLLAMTGIDSNSFTVTRLRALLPSTALANDLILEASPSQAAVPSFYTTQQYTVPNYNPCANNSAASTSSTNVTACTTSPKRAGTRYTGAILLCIGLVGIAFGARRRRG